jgi:hypothetical protein
VKSAILKLLDYMEAIGAPTQPPELDAEGTRALPVFVARIYEVYKAHLFNHEYSLLLCRSDNRPTPAEVEKHSKLARSGLGSRVAFIFGALPSFARKRLVARGIPFIVPGRQTYLPMALIDLRENAKGGQKVPQQARETLSAPAQLLVLYHLQTKKDTDEWPLITWGKVLGYSRSTINRVHKELSNASLCRPVSSGRNVLLRFPRPRRELWELAIPYLGSPVRRRSRVRIEDASVQLFDAGMTALAALTAIAAGRERVCAMSSTAFEAACEDRKLLQTLHSDEETTVIERWRYAPAVLSPDGRTIDRLSLYLSLMTDQNERVQAALAELLEGIPW